MEQHAPFTLPPLPYAYDALEPFISARTLHFHHDKHFAAYVEKLNALLKPYPPYQTWSLERLVRDWAQLPPEIRQDVRNNAGGVYNHALYFEMLHPVPVSSPQPPLEEAITRSFGNLETLKAAMKAAALGQFGSGYAWLMAGSDGTLTVQATANQDVPADGCPLLCCDVWEHAYYLDVQNRRGDYFDQWWHCVDWPKVSHAYADCVDDAPSTP